MKTAMANRLAAVIVVLSMTGSSAFADPFDTEEEAVADAVARFYSALNVLFTGNVEPMKAVWSHAPDVTYMGPDGKFEKGWAGVAANWEVQAALKLGGRVEPVDIQTVIGTDIAYTSNVEVGINTNFDGKAQKVEIRATNIFRKEGGEWKMVAHHTDLLPYLEK